LDSEAFLLIARAKKYMDTIVPAMKKSDCQLSKA
jgi:hypothetical protein